MFDYNQYTIIIEFIKDGEKSIYKIFEFASESQAKGKKGRDELLKKIQLMMRNNKGNENVEIKFEDLIEWGNY